MFVEGIFYACLIKPNETWSAFSLMLYFWCYETVFDSGVDSFCSMPVGLLAIAALASKHLLM